MKRLYLIIIITFTLRLFSNAQQCDSCKSHFDKLISILTQEILNESNLHESWQIVSELYTLGYTDYIDSVVNNTLFVSRSLTKTFCNICIKTNGNIGVDYYFKYLHFTSGSAEEERLFALERLFVRFPEIVLKHIGKNGA